MSRKMSLANVSFRRMNGKQTNRQRQRRHTHKIGFIFLVASFLIYIFLFRFYSFVVCAPLARLRFLHKMKFIDVTKKGCASQQYLYKCYKYDLDGWLREDANE